jgi:hypothetical protein
VAVLPLAAEAVRYAQREAAAEASRVWAAAVARQPGAAAVLRAQAVAAAGQAGAGERPPAVAAGAALLGGAAEAEVAPRALAAAVRQPGVAALRDAGRQREALQRAARAAPWVFHPDQVHPWLARPLSGRFARPMKVQRIAWP